MEALLEEKLHGIKTTLARIGDIRPTWTQRVLKTGVLSRMLSRIEVDGRSFEVTDRFTQSLASRFHVGKEFFRYFTPDEVFGRVQEVHPRSLVRLTTDGDRALGMSSPAKPIVRPAELCRLLKRQKKRVLDVRYENGIVTTTHQLDEADWTIGRDVFSHTYTFETPVDGFGLPSVYLSLIRMICTNGLIGYSPAFRTDIALGKEERDGAEGPLGRAMDCFSNEEGYAAIRERLESARQSEASIFDVHMLARSMSRDTKPGGYDAMRPIYDRFWKLTGDIAVKYGVASDEAISRKKQRMLPMDCSVYDLITFATEVTTHHQDKLLSGRQIHAWVGQTLSTEYDLEGSLIQNSRSEDEPAPSLFLN